MFGVGSSTASSGGSWYFYLQNDPQGSPDGWYAYDTVTNQVVEASYTANLGSATVTAGHYTYSVDFSSMTQRNTSTGKSRPVARTTNGQPPAQIPQGAHVAAAAVAAAPTAFSFAPAAAGNPSNAPSSGVLSATHTSHSNNPFSVAYQAAAPAVSGANAAPSLASPGSNTTSKYHAHWSGNSGTTLVYTAPDNLRQAYIDESKVFSDVTEKDEKKDDPAECVICLDNLHNNSGRVVSLTTCGHAFHYTCIRTCLDKVGAKCPYCSQSMQAESALTPLGQCPSGSMVAYQSMASCAGYEPSPSLHISYKISSGTQKSYHPSPGIHFSGSTRSAYLPDIPEGRDLLVRLQYAFAHGLTFRVGTSLTTHQPNVVTWASLHHKTSMSGGSFGFPDASYLTRCNAELNDKHVPSAAACRMWLESLPTLS